MLSCVVAGWCRLRDRFALVDMRPQVNYLHRLLTDEASQIGLYMPVYT
jgi:hypothetical protein